MTREAATYRRPLIAGKEIATGDGRAVTYPYTGAPVATVDFAGAAEVEQAIAAAWRAFPDYRRVPGHRRARLLARVAQLIADDAERLARTVTLETGKAIWESRVEVERAITTFRLAAEESTRRGEETIELDGVPAGEGRVGFVRRFPLGPVAAITPFNSPLNLVAHKVAPALAVGDVVLVKPAPATPLSAFAIGDMVSQAARELDLPDGLIAVVPADPDVAERLVVDERVRALTFTGSTAVGWELRAKAVGKRVLLELGGVGGVIVHRDADLELAADRCAVGGFMLAGQVCASVQRLLVHEEVADQFTQMFAARVGALRTGDPLEETTRVGPMISVSAAERAHRRVQAAVKDGARLLVGGERDGALMQPTVLTDTRADMEVRCEEVFAPVVVLERYGRLEEAFASLNTGRGGLQAGVFTASVDVAMRAHEEIDVGGVIVNDINGWRVDSMPYGGTRLSGEGREGVRYAMRELTDPRLLVLSTR